MRVPLLRALSVISVVVLSYAPSSGAIPCPTGSAQVSVVREGLGTGTVSHWGPPSPSGLDISCGTECARCYAVGSTVMLASSPSASSVFESWAGCSAIIPWGNLCAVGPLQADAAGEGIPRTITARFTKPVLSIASAPTKGVVISNPAGIRCGFSGIGWNDCSAHFNRQSVVTLTATPISGFDFAGWDRPTCPGFGPCTVQVDEATEVVSAKFALHPELTVARNGSGTVVSSPANINCPPTCSARFPRGTVVSLFAAPAPGAMFLGWTASAGSVTGTRTLTTAIQPASGPPCSGSDATCVMTMGISSVTQPASFSLALFQLLVTKSGSGTVSSDLPGINCGTDCEHVYPDGSLVTLSAGPANEKWRFYGWSGACAGAKTCRLTMVQGASATATFVPVNAP